VSFPDLLTLFASQGIVLLALVAIVVAMRRSRAATAARERAEAANLAKSRFLATVSHEIRTPLNGVAGLAQLLAMTRLTAEQASYVEAIAESGRVLGQLIDDILDFSKIEAGRLDLRREPIAIAPLVESVVELLAPRAFSKGLEIASQIAPDAPGFVIGDRMRLQQALVNLMANAVNYTERGGVGLRLLYADAALRFEVHDTGPGVPEAARGVIFDEFEQDDASATRRHGGAGLGLAISRRLVQEMGGELALADTSAAGSIFNLTLPAPTARQAPSDFLAGQNILVVADSRFEAPYLAETLIGAGAAPTIARGDEVEALLQRDAHALIRPLLTQGPPSPACGRRDAPHVCGSTFDAVIVDCALAPEVVAQTAQAARAAGVERLFLLFSPLERRAFGEAALREFDGWLVKPVRGASLASRLSSIAAQAPAAEAGAPLRSLAGLRALVAEDNDINALIVTRCLEKLGAEATRARDGADAVAMAEAAVTDDGARFDVVLMDLFMPECDGIEATRRIRMAELRARAPRTPIVALTASAFEEDARAARAAGVDAVLHKPVEFATLGATLEELRLTPRAARRAAFAQAPAGAMAPNFPER
jgi:CheY-like chemotaxis protein/nitrogen-specific signal transduction histidine kinase